MVVGHRQHRTSFQDGISIEHLCKCLGRRAFTPGIANNEPHLFAFTFYERQRAFLVVLEISVHVFSVLRQGHPCLNAEQAAWPFAGLRTCAFRMGDTVPGNHPVHLTGVNHLVVAEGVLVLELSLVEIGHRRQSDMGMRAHVDALFRDELSRTHLVKEYKRTDHLAFG